MLVAFTLVTACGRVMRKSHRPLTLRNIHCCVAETELRTGLVVRLPNALMRDAGTHSSHLPDHPKKRTWYVVRVSCRTGPGAARALSRWTTDSGASGG
jgi:hypothetical protein